MTALGDLGMQTDQSLRDRVQSKHEAQRMVRDHMSEQEENYAILYSIVSFSFCHKLGMDVIFDGLTIHGMCENTHKRHKISCSMK